MRIYTFILFSFLTSLGLIAQKPEIAKLAGPQAPHIDKIERVAGNEPVKIVPISPDKVSGSSNDACSEAISLTVGSGFTCSSTATNAVGSSFPNACISTSGVGIQQFRTDWFCFYSGANKTLAIVMNNVVNTTSFNLGMAVFGPYSSCASGCSASMTAPLCDNGLSFQSDSIKILENLSQNAFYIIAIVERRNNPDISGGASASYCIGVQPTNLDDCEVTASGCPTTCGSLCVFGQATAPAVVDVTDNCPEQQYSHRIQGSTLASPNDTVEFCYNFQVDQGCTVSFGGVITASGCAGGNLTSASWRIYNSSTCSVTSSGTSVPPSAVVSTAGSYIYCFKYSAACVLQFGSWQYGYGTCVIENPVLPVELSAFWLSEQGSQNVLNWTTLSESNSLYFEIERSSDGIHFSRIGSVGSQAPNGNSSGRLDYTYTDALPLPGTSYYRLKQTDIGGQFTYSRMIIANGGTGEFRFLGNVYTNGVGSSSVTYSDNGDFPVTLTVTDYAGRILYKDDLLSHAGVNTCYIPSQVLQKGVYIVRIARNDGQFITSKFSRM